MATLSTVRLVLGCDGCDVMFGGPNGFLSGMELRAAAYADGWRFPSQINKAGKSLRSTSDACPKCADGWTPQQPDSRARVMTRAESEALQ